MQSVSPDSPTSRAARPRRRTADTARGTPLRRAARAGRRPLPRAGAAARASCSCGCRPAPRPARTGSSRSDGDTQSCFVAGAARRRSLRLSIDGADAAARSRVALPAGRRARTVGGRRSRRVPLAAISGWRCAPARELVVYELHVGTFTPEGTFAAARQRLRELHDLGITAIELMPVADFAGARNWGYDGVGLFAPSRNYGRPDDLRAFVDAAHGLGLAVILDVVYNHLGPEGAYLPQFYPAVPDRPAPRRRGAAASTSMARARTPCGGSSSTTRCHWVARVSPRRAAARRDARARRRRPRHIVAELAAAVRARGAVAGRDPRRGSSQPRDDRRSAGATAAGGSTASGPTTSITSCAAAWPATRTATIGTTTGSADELARTLRQGWLFTGQHSAHGNARARHRSRRACRCTASSSACRITIRSATARPAIGCITRSTRRRGVPPARCS